MNSRLPKVIIPVVVLLIIISLFYFNKPNETVYNNIENITISLSILAEDLINEETCNQQLLEYYGEYIGVTGEVIARSPLNSETTHSGYIVLSGFVSFYFSDPDEIAKYQRLD